MLETRISELFFRQGPQPDGALPEEEVTRLNFALARRYHSADVRGDLCTAPPEPLPAGTMRYPAFRNHLHRALEHLATSEPAKEKAIQRLIGEMRGHAAQEEVADSNGGTGGLFQGRPAWHAGDSPDIEVSDLEVSDLEEAVDRSTCWTATLPMSPTKLTSSLRHLVAGLEEHEQGQETIKMVHTAALLAIQTSKRALDFARDAGVTAKAAAGRLQAFTEADPRQLLCAVGPAACGDELVLVELKQHEAGYGPEEELAPPVPRRWRFDAGDGLHADIRAAPFLDAERTGQHVFPGEEFEASREVLGDDGVLFLELADGRGWLFQAKPGVGTMCTLAAAPDELLSL